MTPRTARTIAWALWGVALAQVVASAVLLVLNHSIFQAAGDAAIAVSLLATMVSVLISIPLGMRVFLWAERHAKRTGRLKRSG